ncbi:MAG: AAA family ATPase [Saprospiraceae bacterium]
MAKKFNITGVCLPDQHYMADVSGKFNAIVNLVGEGEYFIINRPRQYGKTTMLHRLAVVLNQTGEYLCLRISFEGIGDTAFQSEEGLAPMFFRQLARYASRIDTELSDWLTERSKQLADLEDLSQAISDLVKKSGRKVVVLIDEVDKSSNNQLFLHFLGLLRDKYLERAEEGTFHSVVLAGVHDVKSLKLKLRPEAEAKYNSPWNIATDFKVDMNLHPLEIEPMLREYAADRDVAMDTRLMAERLFYYTSGYPFLVSKLCKMFDEEMLPQKTARTWTVEDVEIAVQQLVRESNTNFENVIKNLENNPELYQIVFNVLVKGEHEDYNLHDPLVNLGLLHGFFKNGWGIRIHNRVYEELIFNYMTSRAKSDLLMTHQNTGHYFYAPNNRLNLEAVLLRFQAFLREEYSRKDRDFLERQGRLIFLAFIKPIINGHGYSFKEPQISEERRLDVVVTFHQHKYVAELKIWRGPEAHQTGLDQLADYLDSLALQEGYLLIFDHSAAKMWQNERIEHQGKKIFAVWV